ncbi:MAG: LysR family transcriptional regulator, partial [Gemmataceae bacterium]|nr:LysR family transcriptional regulator [Gemmataceae bacterium]
MAKRVSILQDLLRFAEIAGRLEQVPVPSFRAIGDGLGISAPAVQDCIRRVEAHLGGVTLVRTAEGVGAATKLTTEGLQFLHQVRGLINWRPSARTVLRVALPHTLLTSQLLTPVLADFQSTYSVRLTLRTATTPPEFDQVIRDLQTERLDAAIAWDARARAQEFPGIERDPLGHTFDVVFISRDRANVTGTVEEIKSRLPRMRLATLRAANQPLLEELPQPNGALGGERTEADTIDTITAFVQAGAADIGLIPANYSVLEHLQLSGHLFFSSPLGKATLVYFRPSGVTGHARDFCQFIHNHFKRVEAQTSRERPTDQPFPFDPAFYEKFAFAYYIDHHRGDARTGPFDPPWWNWEEVGLTRIEPQPAEGTELAFTGSIYNSYRDTFRVAARLVGKDLFYIKASSDGVASATSSVPAFLAVFTWCGLEERDGIKNAIMYGH